MSDDPVRLLDEGQSELLRSLLSAAREEQPRLAALESTLAAVGTGAVLASAGTATTATSAAAAHGALGTASLGAAKGVASSTLVIVVKWLAIGAVVGVAATSTVYGVSGALAPAPRPAHSAAVVLPAAPVTPIAARTPSPDSVVTEVPPPPVVLSAARTVRWRPPSLRLR